LGNTLRWSDLITNSGQISQAELSSLKDVRLTEEFETIMEDIADCYISSNSSRAPVYLKSDGSIIGMGISTTAGILLIPAS